MNSNFDEDEYAYKIHAAFDCECDTDSNDDNSELDEWYYNNKPPAIVIEEDGYDVVKIETFTTVLSKKKIRRIMYKVKQEELKKSSSTCRSTKELKCKYELSKKVQNGRNKSSNIVKSIDKFQKNKKAKRKLPKGVVSPISVPVSSQNQNVKDLDAITSANKKNTVMTNPNLLINLIIKKQEEENGQMLKLNSTENQCITSSHWDNGILTSDKVAKDTNKQHTKKSKTKNAFELSPFEFPSLENVSRSSVSTSDPIIEPKSANLSRASPHKSEKLMNKNVKYSDLWKPLALAKFQDCDNIPITKQGIEKVEHQIRITSDEQSKKAFERISVPKNKTRKKSCLKTSSEILIGNKTENEVSKLNFQNKLTTTTLSESNKENIFENGRKSFTDQISQPKAIINCSKNVTTKPKLNCSSTLQNSHPEASVATQSKKCKKNKTKMLNSNNFVQMEMEKDESLINGGNTLLSYDVKASPAVLSGQEKCARVDRNTSKNKDYNMMPGTNLFQVNHKFSNESNSNGSVAVNNTHLEASVAAQLKKSKKTRKTKLRNSNKFVQLEKTSLPVGNDVKTSDAALIVSGAAKNQHDRHHTSGNKDCVSSNENHNCATQSGSSYSPKCENVHLEVLVPTQPKKPKKKKTKSISNEFVQIENSLPLLNSDCKPITALFSSEEKYKYVDHDLTINKDYGRMPPTSSSKGNNNFSNESGSNYFSKLENTHLEVSVAKQPKGRKKNKTKPKSNELVQIENSPPELDNSHKATTALFFPEEKRKHVDHDSTINKWISSSKENHNFESDSNYSPAFKSIHPEVSGTVQPKKCKKKKANLSDSNGGTPPLSCDINENKDVLSHRASKVMSNVLPQNYKSDTKKFNLPVSASKAQIKIVNGGNSQLESEKRSRKKLSINQETLKQENSCANEFMVENKHNPVSPLRQYGKGMELINEKDQYIRETVFLVLQSYKNSRLKNNLTNSIPFQACSNIKQDLLMIDKYDKAPQRLSSKASKDVSDVLRPSARKEHEAFESAVKKSNELLMGHTKKNKFVKEGDSQQLQSKTCAKKKSISSDPIGPCCSIKLELPKERKKKE